MNEVNGKEIITQKNSNDVIAQLRNQAKRRSMFHISSFEDQRAQNEQSSMNATQISLFQTMRQGGQQELNSFSIDQLKAPTVDTPILRAAKQKSLRRMTIQDHQINILQPFSPDTKQKIRQLEAKSQASYDDQSMRESQQSLQFEQNKLFLSPQQSPQQVRRNAIIDRMSSPLKKVLMHPAVKQSNASNGPITLNQYTQQRQSAVSQGFKNFRPSQVSISKLSSQRSRLSSQSPGMRMSLQPITPLPNQDNRAKHGKLMKQFMKEQKSIQNVKAKSRLDRKNTIIKNVGGYLNRVQTNMKNVKKQQTARASLNNKDEEDNVEDNDDVEQYMFKKFEQMNNHEPSSCIISPEQGWKQMWDLMMMCWVIWQAIIIPVNLSFVIEKRVAMDNFETTLDVCFIIDILLQFNTGFFKNGILIMNRKLIIVDYLKSWFVFDVIATIPYQDFLNANQATSSFASSRNGLALKTPQLIRLIKVIRFLRFLKLLRILKLSKVLQKYDDILYNDTLNIVTSFIKIFIVIIFLAHCLACVFFVVGTASLQSMSVSWTQLSSLDDEEFATQYINSLYWTIETMVTVGYGDIVPTNSYERIYVMFAMIVADGLYAYTLNTISKQVSEYGLLGKLFRENMLYVSQWMASKNLPKDTRLSIKRYLEYQWDLKKQMKIEQQDMMALLNQDLKDKIILYMNGRLLQNLNFSDQLGVEFMSQLVFQMQQMTFVVGEDIVIEGEEGDKIYFIASGRAAVVHKETHTYLEDLVKMDYFGEIAFFTEKPRVATIKSRDFTDILYVDRLSFFEIMEEYPEALNVYHKIKISIVENKDYCHLKLACYVCRKMGHIFNQCPSFYQQKGNLKAIYDKIYRQKEKSKPKAQSSSSWHERNKAEVSEEMDYDEIQFKYKEQRNERNDFKLKNTFASMKRNRTNMYDDECENGEDLVKVYTKAAGGVVDDTFKTETEYEEGDDAYSAGLQGSFYHSENTSVNNGVPDLKKDGI